MSTEIMSLGNSGKTVQYSLQQLKTLPPAPSQINPKKQKEQQKTENEPSDKKRLPFFSFGVTTTPPKTESNNQRQKTHKASLGI